MIDFTKKTNDINVEEVANNSNTANKAMETKKGRVKKAFKTFDEELATLEELEKKLPTVQMDDRERVNELRRQNLPWSKIAVMLDTNVYQVKKLVKE